MLGNFGDDRITLSTCHPKFSARQRLVVVGELKELRFLDNEKFLFQHYYSSFLTV